MAIEIDELRRLIETHRRMVFSLALRIVVAAVVVLMFNSSHEFVSHPVYR